MKVYLICPVRLATEHSTTFASSYVKRLEDNGHKVFWPQRDVNQSDPTGVKIVETELDAIRDADEVHIIWNKNSVGSHFDLGAAMALNKPIFLAHSIYTDGDEKSYEKVIAIKMIDSVLI